MYLNNLSEEKKELFLDLCIYAAEVNDNFTDEEKLYIQQYCDEMNIPLRYSTQKDYDELIKELSISCSDFEIRIIVLELTALVLSDSNYDDDERNFIGKLIEKSNITIEEYEKITCMLENLVSVYQEFNNFIFAK